MNIEQVMTRSVFTCDTRDTVNRAAQIMWDRNCACVMVLDEQRKLAGIVTQRDVAMAAYTQGKQLADIGVTVAMSHRVHTIRETASIATAERIMRESGVRRLPVIDAGGHVIGLVTRTILRRAQSESDELPCNLAAVTESRHH